MKDQFSREDMEMLAAIEDENCVSIYMPTLRTGRETEQNHICLKNLVSEAQKQLVEQAGMRAPEAETYLDPIKNLLSDYEFWQYQSEGLALFLAEDGYHRYRLPIRFSELAIIGRNLHLKPLLPVFSGDGVFYILALAQGETRLFQATRYNVEELEAEELPKSLADALWYYDEQEPTQYHQARSPGIAGEGKAGNFQGQGVGDVRSRKDFILEYFRQIDAGLKELLRKEQAPLVLAGVEYLHPIYREANTYSNLLEDGIVGSPKMMSGEELHQRAWPIVETYFDAPRQEAFERFNNLHGTGTTSTDLAEIVPAAHYGRVDTLFVARDQYRWGRFDPENNAMETFEESHPDNQDLLDRAAVQTFLNSGTVYVVDTGNIPGGSDIAAIYRY